MSRPARAAVADCTPLVVPFLPCTADDAPGYVSVPAGTALHVPSISNGTVLGFDFGEKRIGAAMGDFAVGIAHPLTTITAGDRKTRYAALEQLVCEWQPSLLVVGLPAHMDGTEHELSRLTRKFARELGERFKLPVELVDERLTSAEADASLRDAGVKPLQRKQLLDQVAAQHILQAYFDTRGRRP